MGVHRMRHIWSQTGGVGDKKGASDKDRYFPQALEKKGLQEINLESALMKPEERDDACGGRTLLHLTKRNLG